MFSLRLSYSAGGMHNFRDAQNGGWQKFLYLLTGLAYLWVVFLIVLLFLGGKVLQTPG